MNEREPKKKSVAMEWIQTIVVAILLAALIKHFIFNTTMVMGHSMEPTLHEGDRMICLVFPLYYSEPDYGDIVIVKSPLEGDRRDFVKRVVGRPGDVLDLKDGVFTRNGKVVEEPYIAEDATTENIQGNHWELSENQFFVVGDNRYPGMSEDSRAFGPIDKKTIHSIAKLRYYPFSAMGSV